MMRHALTAISYSAAFLPEHSMKRALVRAGLALLLLQQALLAGACSKTSPAVCIEKRDGSTVCVSVETARTQSQRQLGLMYRRELAPGRGMLFVFEAETPQAFTMRNTYIPLDMIFIGGDRRIKGIVENAPPLTAGPFKVDAPSRYVLEVTGGFCRDNGIAAGDRVTFRSVQ
jgi:hypothetical protein